MPKTDLISKQCQQLSEQFNVLIASYTFHNIVLQFWMIFTENCYHRSLQQIFILSWCGMPLKELKKLQAEKSKLLK